MTIIIITHRRWSTDANCCASLAWLLLLLHPILSVEEWPEFASLSLSYLLHFNFNPKLIRPSVSSGIQMTPASQRQTTTTTTLVGLSLAELSGRRVAYLGAFKSIGDQQKNCKKATADKTTFAISNHSGLLLFLFSLPLLYLYKTCCRTDSMNSKQMNE